MPSTTQVTDIVDKVRKRLDDNEKEGIHLKVVSEKLDDDWLYIVVVPSKAGVALRNMPHRPRRHPGLPAAVTVAKAAVETFRPKPNR